MSHRVVLVTGASTGIGSRISQLLVTRGYTVIGIGRRPISEWEFSAEAFHPYSLDITVERDVKRWFSTLRKEFGTLDVLINNAGIFSADLLLTASTSRFSKVIESNLIGAELMTRESVKLMTSSGFGRVINISSIAAQIPLPGNSFYATSKRSVEQLMQHFALEFRGKGITFNSVEISFIEGTPMQESLNSNVRSLYESRLLVSDPVTIEELGEVIEFLTSPTARHLTGQVLALGSPF